jgi:hypothetical protein
MTYAGRLRVVGAFLALGLVLTTLHVWGDPSRKDKHKGDPSPTTDQADNDFSTSLAKTKFASGATLSYRTSEGDVLFALQLRPKLEAQPAAPTDYLFLADTSASQAKGPLDATHAIAQAAIEQMQSEDRVALWTINIPEATRDLTRGFRPASAESVHQALATLKQEVPLGDTDLKDGLRKAIASFEHAPGRQQAVVLLGDGMSIHDPINPSDRQRLCDDMIKRRIIFYSVPLGPRFDPANLHGLATGTGGAVVRFTPELAATEVAKNLRAAVSVPVMYPKRFQLGAEVTDVLPTKLPPLRGDAPTLVVGKIKPDAALSYTLEGSLAGKDVKFENTEPLPASEPDNFFLVGIQEQWKKGKDQPALARSDRALALAYEQNKLARDDLVVQAEWALEQDKLEAAHNLFEQAQKLDPLNVEAAAGLKVINQFKSGTLTKAKLREELARGDKSLQQLVQRTEQAPPPAPNEPAPAAAPQDLLQEQRQRQGVEEQRLAGVVDDAVRQARQTLPRDPDAARDLLRRTYSSVQADPALSDRVRVSLSNRLEAALRNVDIEGARIRLEQEEQLRLLANSRRLKDIALQRDVDEERTRARMQRFSNLIAQARYEDAYLLALAVQQDAINSGRGVPPAATAGYDVALNANNLTQIQELRRVREERFLLTMMQVERSHVPFPDEPPIQFPPAAVWDQLTKFRKERYENSGLTEDDPVTLRQIKQMKEKLNKTVNLDKGIDANTPLRDAIEFLQDRYDVTIIPDQAAFKADQQIDNINEQPVQLPRMMGVSLATVLRLLTAQVNGTYLVRRDYIEITTGQRAVAEKVIRVYPVADLVIPIPNSVNRAAVNQSVTILGTAPGIGLALGSPQALGGIGQGLGVGAGLGALGAGLGLGGGGLGGLGGLGGGQGFGGGMGGFGGGLGFAGGVNNLGVGGGQLGLGGGQLGQFGNLGGQFGLQGGDQSAILIELIRQVVGNTREWQRPGIFQRPVQNAAVNPAGQPGDEDSEGTERLNPELLNSVGYYPPSRALVVKGTSRFHTGVGGAISGVRPGMAALDRKDRDALAKANEQQEKERKNDLKQLADRVAKNDKNNDKAELDPKKIWQDALAKGVNDPGLIIAVADFLAQCKLYDHVAEFLKADLRQGVCVRPWVYEALALALEESHGAPEDIERARVSAVDLEPTDAQGYLKASEAMNNLHRYDRALAYCRQASLLEPNLPTPYEEALLYAQEASDPSAMQWAAGNLLRHDWPVENQELHLKAGEKLKDFLRALRQKNRSSEAERLAKTVEAYRERDLVIEINYEGDADIELEVKEPIGAICSFMQRQTPGGGTLLGSTLKERTHASYVAPKAFPGEYKATLRRIYGRPVGGKVTVEVIKHQGTPHETRQRETLVFDRHHTLTVTLDDGRRTTAAYVPPPGATRKESKPVTQMSSSDRVLAKIRALANPELAGGDTRMKGGMASSLGQSDSDQALMPPGPSEVPLYQNRVKPLVANSTDFTIEATVSPDQSTARLHLTPIFQTAEKAPSRPEVANPFIPGGAGSSADEQ